MSQEKSEIFVFGSNLAGRHGAGSAKEAFLHHGAKIGVGWGPQGNSYAIPTKDHNLNSLPLNHIQAWIKVFICYAKANTDTTFNVVKIGCGLAGYYDYQIAPMFKDSPSNVNLPEGWRK